jgi:mono/diheme cytochrome c family protein
MIRMFQRAPRVRALLSTIAALPLFALLLPELVSALAASSAVDAGPAPSPAQTEFFEKKIRPVLNENCYTCHSSSKRQAGRLRLDERSAILQGGKSGPAIVAGDPAGSLLIQRLEAADVDERMPKDEEALPPAVIADFKTWIKQGAYWPAAGDKATSVKSAALDFPANADQVDFFVKKVKPILADHCYACHAADTKPAAGLRLDTSLGLKTGGRSGQLFNTTTPDESLLIKKVLAADPKKRMPKESPALSEGEIATLRAWIAKGAVLPDETETAPPMSATLQKTYEKLRHEHWAFQPVGHPQLPAVKNAAWASNDIDRFLLAKLEEKNIKPVRDASPETLLRRVTFDLTGLQATPEQVKAFSLHHSRADYEKLVDSLLASRQYAERWGRHWLDVARYGESTGPSRNVPYPHAWRYRDYVIDSVAEDVPYNRFLTEQLAGDLLPAKTEKERDRLAIATGFLALGVKDVNQRFEARFQMDNADEQIDAVTRSTMALTVTCARCHDHKFDPIPQKDYYALAGIFTSTESLAGVRSLMGGAGIAYYDPKHLLLLSSATKPNKDLEALKGLNAEIEANHMAIESLQNSKPVLDQETKEKIASMTRTGERLQEDRLALEDPATQGFGVHAVREGQPADTSIRIRGAEERHGPLAPRGFLTAFEVPDTPAINLKQSGRLELAGWIASPQNPLTARVAVNRTWAYLFGQGIVSTVDNFGVKGDRPSNPELFDYLARHFVANGWSQKKLIREIALSHAYRLRSESDAKGREVDPSNRLLWRHSPRRLEAEEVRDSILRASGELNESHPLGSPSMQLRMVEMGDSGPVAKAIYDEADRSRYRSVYLPAVRGITPRAVAAFDPVSQSLVTGKRDVTIVPTQALFLMNSTFVRQQALAETQLIEKESSDRREQVRRMYVRSLDREPTKSELDRGLNFLDRYQAAWSQDKSAAQSVQLAESLEAEYLVPEQSDEKGMKVPFEYGDMLARNYLIFNDPEVAPGNAQEAALAALAQALFASAEFQFVR